MHADVPPNWASAFVERLRAGETVKMRPLGRSMEPLITVTVAPLVVPPKIGDVVLVDVRGRTYLHLVKDACHRNRGKLNGWVEHDAIHGIRVG